MSKTPIDYVPTIFDTTRRWVRTAIQTGIPAFIAFAGVLPAVLPLVHVAVGPRLWAILVATAAGITTAAALLSRIMALPAVNRLLELVNLGGHSGPKPAADVSYTTALDLPSRAQLTDASH